MAHNNEVLKEGYQTLISFINCDQKNYSLFLCGIKGLQYFGKTIKALNKDDISNLEELMKNLKKKIESKEITDFKAFYRTDDRTYLFKEFEKTEKEFFDIKLQEIFDDDIPFENYLKKSFDITMLVIRLQCPSINTSSIYFFKNILHTFYAKKRKALINFDGSQKVKIITSNKEVIINDDFDFIIYYSKVNGLSLVLNRENFEKFFQFVEKYEKAFDMAKKRFNFINWENVTTSLPVNRKCYDVLNFPKLDKCLNEMTKELSKDDDNFTRKFFNKKNINFAFKKDGTLEILPSSKIDLNYILKGLQDFFVKTHYLQREGIAGEFEE